MHALILFLNLLAALTTGPAKANTVAGPPPSQSILVITGTETMVDFTRFMTQSTPWYSCPADVNGSGYLSEMKIHTVTVSTTVPSLATLNTYKQVWDMRFSAAACQGSVAACGGDGISATQQANYLSYIAGGGSLFLMGDNGGYPGRNAPIQAIARAVDAAGTFQTTGLLTNNDTQQGAYIDIAAATLAENMQSNYRDITGTNRWMAAQYNGLVQNWGAGYPVLRDNLTSNATAIAFDCSNMNTSYKAGKLMVVFDWQMMGGGGQVAYCGPPTYTGTTTGYNERFWENSVDFLVPGNACASPTFSPTLSSTPTVLATSSSTETRSNTVTPSLTPTNTATSTQSFTQTATPTSSSSPTNTDTATKTTTATPSFSSSSTNTIGPSATDTCTMTASPSSSSTPSQTSTSTATSTVTETQIFTATDTPTSSVTPSNTLSSTATPTSSASPSASPSSTATSTGTISPSVTSTSTATASSTPSTSFTISATPTPSWTASATPIPVPHHVTISVYNAAGELVKVLFNGAAQFQPGQLSLDKDVVAGGILNIGFPGYLFDPAQGGVIPSIQWGTANASGQPVRSGVYYIKADIVDPFGQTTTLQRAVQVLNVATQNSLSIYNSAGELVTRLPLPSSGTGHFASVRLPEASFGVKYDAISGAIVSAPFAIIVKDEQGIEYPLYWDGRNAQGLPVASGSYTAELVYTAVGNGGSRVVESKGLVVIQTGNSASLAGAFAYPNPSLHGAAIVVQYPVSLQYNTTAHLYSLSGESVGQAGDPGQSGRLSFQTTGLASGVYALKIEKMSGSAVAVRTILKVAIVR